MDDAIARRDALIRSAARRLTGYQRRLFQAGVATGLCDGNARQAERRFGWGRDTVATGLNEWRSGIRCREDFAARDTSDAWVEALKRWWVQVREGLGHVGRLGISLDNGPKDSGRRTQPLKRMVQFADWSGLEGRAVYDPPYHIGVTPFDCSESGRPWPASAIGPEAGQGLPDGGFQLRHSYHSKSNPIGAVLVVVGEEVERGAADLLEGGAAMRPADALGGESSDDQAAPRR